MNEPFDVEISRALKEGAVKSLEGFEFTPAMRAKVMDRIRSEAPEAPPAKRFDVNRAVRPLAWVAVAAAAMVIVINTDLSRLPGFGSAKKSEMKMETASAPAAAPAPPADNMAVAKSAPAEPKADSQQPRPTEQQSTGGGNAAGTTPTTTATAVAPKAPEARQVATIELTAPTAANARSVSDAPLAFAPPAGSPKMSVAAAAASNIGGAVPQEGEVLTLSPLGVKKVDLNNAVVWDRPLADLTQQSVLATAPDGRAAVANGSNLIYLLNNRGELDLTIHGDATINQVAWSNDGRVASVEAKQVVVYGADSGKALFTVEAGEASQVAFTPDGTLAVYSARTPDTRTLTLLDAKGTEIANAQPAVAGAGLAVTPDGQVVVAGGQAYSRAGDALWQVPFKTEGLAVLGDRIVAWDAHHVMTVDARTGSQTGWKAEWKGTAAINRVVTSPDGRYVVITAQAEDGALLWVLDRDGKVLLSEKLPQMPVDVGFAGAQIVLIEEGSVQYRLIPQ